MARSRVNFTLIFTFTALQGTVTNAVFIWKGDNDWPIRKDVEDVVAHFKTQSCQLRIFFVPITMSKQDVFQQKSTCRLFKTTCITFVA